MSPEDLVAKDALALLKHLPDGDRMVIEAYVQVREAKVKRHQDWVGMVCGYLLIGIMACVVLCVVSIPVTTIYANVVTDGNSLRAQVHQLERACVDKTLRGGEE